MARGLGKIERAILQYMESKQKSNEEETAVLLINIFYPERVEENGNIWDFNHTDAQYKSLLRSLESLERKGYITSKKRVTAGNRPYNWWKRYTLTTY